MLALIARIVSTIEKMLGSPCREDVRLLKSRMRAVHLIWSQQDRKADEQQSRKNRIMRPWSSFVNVQQSVSRPDRRIELPVTQIATFVENIFAKFVQNNQPAAASAP